MSAPAFKCEVAFATNPGSAPTWTDLTSRLLEFRITRGRQMELDKIDAGTGTFRFLNSDRALDPTHAGSTYYPNVLPMRRIRLTALHNAVTYNLFSGFVDSWPQTWEGPTVGYSEVSATDAFRPLAMVDVSDGTTWPREFSGARITRILDAAGWPAGDRALDTGFSEIAEATLPLGSGMTALGAIDKTVDAELGMFFCDGRGYAVFHDREHRRAASYLTSQATFGDAASGFLPYQSVVLDTDADRIWNDVQITGAGGVAQQAQDTTSQTTYLRRTLTRQVPLARDTEAADQAASLLAQYKDPRYRLAAIGITPYTDALWVQALARELGDHVTVKRWPQQVGSAITQECSIESLDLHGVPGGASLGAEAKVTWLLSTPAYTAVDWWLLGDSTYGVLDSTTKVVY